MNVLVGNKGRFEVSFDDEIIVVEMYYYGCVGFFVGGCEFFWD